MVRRSALFEYREAFWRLNEAVSAFLEGELNDTTFEQAYVDALAILKTCVHCGQPAEGFAAQMDDRLCHGDTRDCYSTHGPLYGERYKLPNEEWINAHAIVMAENLGYDEEHWRNYLEDRLDGS